MLPAHRALQRALAACMGETDTQLKTFLPVHTHGELLRDRCIVIEGERGAGKTALFRFFEQMKRRGVPLRVAFPEAPTQEQTWLVGFDESREHPPSDLLARWAEGRDPYQLQQLWVGHLAGVVATHLHTPPAEVPWLRGWQDHRGDPSVWVPAVGEHLPEVYHFLDRAELQLKEQERTLLVAYDSLDRMVTHGGELETSGQLSAALLSVWLRLRGRYQHLRGKVFLRPDLLKRARVATTDASKLRAHQLTLSWTAPLMYRLLLRRMMAAETLHPWLQEMEGLIMPSPTPHLGYLPPEALPETVPAQPQLFPGPTLSQRAFATHLVGLTMGKGVKKGYTHRWIINHSVDGKRQILPRVTLNLIQYAVERAIRLESGASSPHLFTVADLEAAQTPAGERRLEELREAHPVAWRLEQLRDRLMPLDRPEAEALLGVPHLEHPDGCASGVEAIRRLVELGALIERPPRRGHDTHRVDLPDLYRRPLQAKRRGGPQRR